MRDTIAEMGVACRSPYSVFQKLALYARTIRHLKLIQIYSRVQRTPRYRQPGPLKLENIPKAWQPAIVKLSPQLGPNRFRFLNQERKIDNWSDPSASRLWLYNLHYFEYVDGDLVNRWIAENPPAKGIGWDPYPTSRRIANWCKWILGGVTPPQSVLTSLAGQASWIERRVEWHLLANHVLANAKALVFLGALTRGEDAVRWLRKGTDILEKELPRQILSDGAHCERSPMYHSIVLEDLLDLCNLRQALSLPMPDLGLYASRMLGWLDEMVHPDGEISFFNDAALGIAPRRDELKAYAARLSIAGTQLPLGESGYRRLSNDRATVIFDAAPLGPDYQPGHGHADALSFEASVDGRRALVNSGISTYDAGDQRSFEVGTGAHNTVRIDSHDQSEMWGAFRVARRAPPFDVRTDGRSAVEGAHIGYYRKDGKVTHRRRLELTGSGLVITDSLEGHGEHRAELFLHLAPDARVRIWLDPQMVKRTVSSTYFPWFSAAVPNQTIVGDWFGECPARFKTFVQFEERA